MTTIQFNNVSFGYNPKNLLFQNINIELEQGEEGKIYALAGGSGRGKTTLAKLILGVLKPSSGEIRFSKANILSSYVPQQAVLFDHLTTHENAAYFSRLPNYKKAFDPDLFEELVDVLDMRGVINNPKSVQEISGGTQQRLMLLRALSIRPDVLILDEPTNGLDSELKLDFLQLLRKIIKKYGILAVYITHHKSEVELVADELLFIDYQSNQNSVLKGGVCTMKTHPPTIGVARFLGGQFQSTLFAEISADRKQIRLSTRDNPEAVQLVISPDNINGTNHPVLGIRGYTIESRSPLYTTLRLGSKQSVVCETAKIENATGLLFVGKMNVFSMDGYFQETIDLEQYLIKLSAPYEAIN